MNEIRVVCMRNRVSVKVRGGVPSSESMETSMRISADVHARPSLPKTREIMVHVIDKDICVRMFL